MLRVGVVGVGNMGKNHARVCNNIKGIELIGVTDISLEVAKNVANLYGCKYFTNYKEFLNEGLDFVIVSAPTIFHYDIAKYFIQHGINVFIEKPITEKVEQAEELIKIADQNNIKLGVGHIERFNSAYKVLKKIIEDDKIIAIDINRMSHDDRIKDVDVVTDLMVHDIDLLIDLIGLEFDSFYSVKSNVNNNMFCDYCTTAFSFPNGIIGSITSSRVTEHKIREIKITTIGKYYYIDLLKKNIKVYSRTKLRDKSEFYTQENIIEVINVPNTEALYDEICDFRDAILFNKNPLVTGEDGIRALKNIYKILDK